MRISDWSSDVCSSDLLVEQMIGLARDDKFDRSQVGALMEKLEHRMLRVGADAAPGDRRGLLRQRLAGEGHRLAVRFHFELLEIVGEQPQPLVLDRKSTV